jgi:hypothetical protein
LLDKHTWPLPQPQLTLPPQPFEAVVLHELPHAALDGEQQLLLKQTWPPEQALPQTYEPPQPSLTVAPQPLEAHAVDCDVGVQH